MTPNQRLTVIILFCLGIVHFTCNCAYQQPASASAWRRSSGKFKALKSLKTLSRLFIILQTYTTVISFRLLSFVQQENWHSKFRLWPFNMEGTLKSEVCAFMEVHQRDLKFVSLKEVLQFSQASSIIQYSKSQLQSNN